MRLFDIPAYFYPEQISSSHLDDDMHWAFVKAGIKVELYAPTPCRGISKEQRRKYKKKRIEKMFDGGLTVHRYPLFKESKSPVLRAFRYIIQCIQQFNRGLFAKGARQCDVMFIGSTPPIHGATATLIKKIRRIPFVYNLQDIFPDSLVGTNLAQRGDILWKIGRVIEDFTYRNADRIIVISEDFKSNIMAKGVPEEKIEVVYNWVDENAVVPVPKGENPLFDEFCIDRDKFHVVYAGNLGNAQNIDVIVDAAKELVDNKDIEFLIFGTGGLKDQFEQKVRDYGIDNVRFFPLQPMERVGHVYGLGDVCVVSCKPGLGGAAMPSKMLSIMSAGRAVIASFDSGELTHILEDNECGVYAPAGDVDAFVSLIRSLSSNRSRCDEMGCNARKLILRRFTKDYGTSEYIRVIKEVCNNKG